MLINEVLDKPLPFEFEHSYDDQYTARFDTPDGGFVELVIEIWGDEGWWYASFSKRTPAGRWTVQQTGEGHAFQILATIIAALKKFAEIEKPKILVFDASKEDNLQSRPESRIRLYRAMLQRYLTGYTVTEFDKGTKVRFKLKRISQVNTAKEK